MGFHSACSHSSFTVKKPSPVCPCAGPPGVLLLIWRLQLSDWVGRTSLLTVTTQKVSRLYWLIFSWSKRLGAKVSQTATTLQYFLLSDETGDWRLQICDWSKQHYLCVYLILLKANTWINVNASPVDPVNHKLIPSDVCILQYIHEWW